MIKRIMVAMLVIIFGLSGCSTSSSELILTGIVEANIVSHCSEVNGRVLEMPFELGQKIQKGELVAALDDSSERNKLEQLEATLALKEAALNELTAAADAEAVKLAQNDIAIAEVNLKKSRENYEYLFGEKEKIVKLYEGGADTASAVEKIELQLILAENDLNSADTQIDNAKQRLAMLLKGASREKIAVHLADIQLIKVQIAQSQENLAKYKVFAFAEGTVISKNYTIGDMVSAGYNLMDVTDESKLYLLGYLPEEYISLVKHGQELTVRSRQQDYKGTVVYIGLQAQYTPKELQSSVNKNKKSVKIKVQLTGPIDATPGEEATLIILK